MQRGPSATAEHLVFYAPRIARPFVKRCHFISSYFKKKLKSYLDSWCAGTWQLWRICWLFDSLAGILFFYHTHNINCELQQWKQNVTYYLAFVCLLVTSCTKTNCLVSGSLGRKYHTRHSNSRQSLLASVLESRLPFLCGIILEWIHVLWHCSYVPTAELHVSVE